MKIGVVGRRRPPRFVGVIAFDRPLWVSIQRLDGDISVKNPGLTQHRRDTVVQVIL
jgi:hypothetical protein